MAAVEAVTGVASTPSLAINGIGGTAAPAVVTPGGSSAIAQFQAAMERARTGMSPEQRFSLPNQSSAVGEMLGFDRIGSMATQLSQADRESFRSVEKLATLDPSDPTLQAQILGVSLEAAKSSISSTLAMKFSSKVSEGLNTLLKNS